MPSSERTRTAFAVGDIELADWAQTQGLAVTPTQVAAWRRSGLIPSPTEVGERPVGATPGRAPRRYTDTDLDVARQVVGFLAETGHRGRPHADLALLMFASGLTVAPEVVTAAMARQLAIIEREIDSLIARADAEADDVPEEMKLSLAFERAEWLAWYAIRSRAKLASQARRQLRLAGLPAKDPDVLAVLVPMLRMMLGEPPSPDDTVALEGILHMYDAHGLVEPATPDGSAVVPEGPSALGDSLALAVQLGLFYVPDDITSPELNEARDLARSLSAALQAIPDPRLRRLVGGELVAGFWQPTDPFSIAQVIVHIVKLLRHGGFDASPIIDAVRQQGWLDN